MSLPPLVQPDDSFLKWRINYNSLLIYLGNTVGSYVSKTDLSDQNIASNIIIDQNLFADKIIIGNNHINNGDSTLASIAGGENNQLNNTTWSDNSPGGNDPEEEYFAEYTFIGGGQNNRIHNAYCVIGGGQDNRSYCIGTAVLGGLRNYAGDESYYTNLPTTLDPYDSDRGNYAIVVGGTDNGAPSRYSSIVGGLLNSCSGDFSFIGNGQDNLATAIRTFVGNGFENVSSNSYSTAVNGVRNLASGEYSSIVGGIDNSVSQTYSFVGGGNYNSVEAISGFIGNGFSPDGVKFNRVVGRYGFIGSGSYNIAGNPSNINNSAIGIYAGIVNGRDNISYGSYSFIGSGDDNNIFGHDQASLEFADYSSIVGGLSNRINSVKCFIGGGENNAIDPGIANEASPYGTIGGGLNNSITNSSYGFVGGGQNNAIIQNGAFPTTHCAILGGNNNQVRANNAVVVGGNGNLAQGENSIVGGATSSAFGESCIAFGNNASAVSNYSMAFGRNAQTNSTGQLTLADATPEDFSNDIDTSRSWTLNEFNARFTGGFAMVSSVDGNGVPNAGVRLPSGGNAWSTISDKNVKDNFVEIDHNNTINKLRSLDLTQWSYKSDLSNQKDINYYGFMAQDFHKSFDFGKNVDKLKIDTLQYDGVMASAIKGLIETTDKQAKLIADLQDEIKNLRKQI